MSSTIWMQCAASSRPLTAEPYRVVEAQHLVATRKLVDTDEEQALLESLLEEAKPPVPPEAARLHYLLSTPFRYPPLRHGSRLGSRLERGIWYGSDALTTAFAEVAYYRLLFLDGTAADLAPLEVELTSFQVRVRAARGVDLAEEACERFRARIASPVDLTEAQALGAAMRADGIQACRLPSARDPEAGTNLAVFDPRAFRGARPKRLQTWHCVATPDYVEVGRKDYFDRASFRWPRESFELDGVLPRPAT